MQRLGEMLEFKRQDLLDADMTSTQVDKLLRMAIDTTRSMRETREKIIEPLLKIN